MGRVYESWVNITLMESVGGVPRGSASQVSSGRCSMRVTERETLKVLECNRSGSLVQLCTWIPLVLESSCCLCAFVVGL